MTNKIWQRTATTKHMMKGVQALEMGFNVDECHVRGLVEQGKVNRSQRKLERGILKLALEAKIWDQCADLVGMKDQQGIFIGQLATRFGRSSMSLQKLRSHSIALD